MTTSGPLRQLLEGLVVDLRDRRWAATLRRSADPLPWGDMAVHGGHLAIDVDAPGAGERATIVRTDPRHWTVTLQDRDGGQLDDQVVLVRVDAIDDRGWLANALALALCAIWARVYFAVESEAPACRRRRRAS